MEKRSGQHLFLLIFSISHLFSSSPSLASILPSHGCYWTESCQNKWVGGCGSGHVIIDQSDDCNGLCSVPKYPPCLPFYTHFRCCKPESPKVTDRCTKCKNKVDYGDEYICCTDCSDPYITDKNTKLGYCKTGVELAVQLKPKEVFQWIAGPWMKCSSPCDGGVRYRDVGCFGSIEGASVAPYPVDNIRCSDIEMPTSQEPCSLRSCEDFSRSRRRSRRQAPERKMPVGVPMANTPEESNLLKPVEFEARETTTSEDSRNRATVTRNLLVSEKEELLTIDTEGQTSYRSKSSPFRRRSLMSNLKFFGVELSPDNIAVAMVYFVQGVLGLSRLAVSFYLKDDLHLDPAETAVISGASALPWLIKPLYGFISDSFPLFGYRRRSYLVLSGLLGALSWTMMATFVDSKYDAAFCILLGSLSVAFSDVVVDSMVVERARGESQSTSGSLQSLCWGSSAFGGIVSAYFSGSLVDAYGVRFVFGVTAFLPLITSAVAILVSEQRILGAVRGRNAGFIETSRQNIIQLWDAVRQPNIFLPTMFIFLWEATPQSDSAMFFFITNKLGFTPEFLGRVRLVTSVASLLGVGIYNGFLKSVPLRKIFLFTTIIGAALGMTQVFLVTGLNRQLGVSDEWFSIGDSLVITVLSQASFMPVLVLAARLCPQGMEATLFATLMSISNGGSVAGGLLGAVLTQLLGVTKDSFDNLALLIIICSLSSLLPLPLLGLLPRENADSLTERDADIEGEKRN